MLSIAIPKGSLEEGTFRLFQQADIPLLRRNERDYILSINDPRISEAFLLRPPEIAYYVGEGDFDIGITGFDWIRETKATVQEITDLQFSRGGWNPVKIVLATDVNNPIGDVKDISTDDKVVTEYPVITKAYFRKLGKGNIKVWRSFGATEVQVPRLAKYLVDVTETGRTLMENGKKILDTLLISSTKLIANPKAWNDPKKRQAINEITELLLSVIRARDKVLIKMNVAERCLQSILDYLPSMRAPAVTPLLQSLGAAGNWYGVETVVEKPKLNVIIPEIRRLGATDILEIDVAKVIP